VTTVVAAERNGVLAVVARLAGILDALTEGGDWDRAAAVERDIAGLLRDAIDEIGAVDDGADGQGRAGAQAQRRAEDLATLRQIAELHGRATARLGRALAELQKERDRLHRGRREASAYLEVALGN
jgi:hypothetical protein